MAIRLSDVLARLVETLFSYEEFSDVRGRKIGSMWKHRLVGGPA